MIDALLYAVRDTIRAAGIGYGAAECDIVADEGGGRPPPRCGNFFVAVHGGHGRNDSTRNLDERFGFAVTITARVTGPLDRVGDQQIALDITRVPLGQRRGFNARIEQLRGLLNANWAMTVLLGQKVASANDRIVQWAAPPNTVYGFVEPAVYRSSEVVTLVGDDWFGCEPKGDMFGIKAALSFEGARRLQPQTQAVGPTT